MEDGTLGFGLRILALDLGDTFPVVCAVIPNSQKSQEPQLLAEFETNSYYDFIYSVFNSERVILMGT